MQGLRGEAPVRGLSTPLLETFVSQQLLLRAYWILLKP